jgi:hypothetical protein
LLHAAAFVGSIVALHTSGGSIRVSLTVPVICQDYRADARVVRRCNDEQPFTPPLGGIVLGKPYLRDAPRVPDEAEDAAPSTPPPAAHVTSNAALCLRCSFH